MRDHLRWLLITCAAGAAAALTATPAALAEPAAPAPVLPAPVTPVPVPSDSAGSVSDPAAAAALTAGTPHLPSPDALPAGTTMDPALAVRDPSPHTSYLRDLWQAVQNQEISGKEAVILGLSQRNLSAPIPQQAPGPNVPIQYPRDPAPLPSTAPLPTTP